jgi:outer membrane immunogenic protein
VRMFAAAACLSATLSGSAFAAEGVPPPGPSPKPRPLYYGAPPAHPPPYNWTGFYVGVNGGYGFVGGTSTASISGGLLNGATGTGSGNLSGALAGGQLGANYQINSFVIGVEGDFDWSGQSRSNTLAS